MTARYPYQYGMKTLERAQNALEDLFASGQVSEAERPLIECYHSRSGTMRYMITLEA